MIAPKDKPVGVKNVQVKRLEYNKKQCNEYSKASCNKESS